MKQLFFSAGIFLTTTFATAQLPDGSISPDFQVEAFQSALSASGMNSDGTYRLYDYLDAGYTVVVDISATWCWPCWEFHQSGILEELYAAHGPLLPGHPGVNANSTNDVMVFWLDLDPDTEDSDVLDGSGSIGNWANPTGTAELQFPVVNPGPWDAYQLNEAFEINAFPTIYMICPNRTTTIARLDSAEEYYSLVGGCPVASGSVNPMVLDGSCAQDGAWVALQNMGSDHLTSATLELRLGNTVVNTLNWSGDLSTYALEEVYLGPMTNGVYSVGISSQDDVPEPGNNSLNLRPVWTTDYVTVEITTDAYGDETRWSLREDIATNMGPILYLGGPFETVTAPGTVVQPPVTVDLEPNTCYKFFVGDEFGDGMDSGFGEGSFRLKDAAGNILFEGGDFEDFVSYDFMTGALLGMEEGILPDLTVYPNPASETIFVAFTADNGAYSVSLVDLQGRVLSSSSYKDLPGEQKIAVPVMGMAPGNYLVRVSSNGISTVRSVVVH